MVVGLFVRCESPGPVISHQEPVRTAWSPLYRPQVQDHGDSGPERRALTTERGNPRVTRIGRFLREYKLDELPQLFNVLRGQMRRIGPRPKVPHLEAMPMLFRPGLTGAATLAFRREEEMLQDGSDDDLEVYYCRMIKPLKSKIDWEYMCESTLASDLALLYQTARCCVSTRGSSWAVDCSESARRAFPGLDRVHT